MPGRPIKYTGCTRPHPHRAAPGVSNDPRRRPINCLTKIVAKSGVRGLYRGLVPALLKAIPAVSIGYGAFEAAKQLMA